MQVGAGRNALLQGIQRTQVLSLRRAAAASLRLQLVDKGAEPRAVALKELNVVVASTVHPQRLDSRMTPLVQCDAVRK